MSILSIQKFKLVNRGFKNTLLLLPGWACDWRIFSRLDIEYNYIFALDNVTARDIALYLQQAGIERISVLGFSMGSFVSADFAAAYPGYIKDLFLVSSCIKPDAALMDDIKSKVGLNRRAFLYRFYLSCFSRTDKESLRVFRKELMNEYLDIFTLKVLLRDLDYLKNISLSLDGINNAHRAVVCHGREDKVFPYENSLKIKELCPKVDFVTLDNAGHALFANNDFISGAKIWFKSQ